MWKKNGTLNLSINFRRENADPGNSWHVPIRRPQRFLLPRAEGSPTASKRGGQSVTARPLLRKNLSSQPWMNALALALLIGAAGITSAAPAAHRKLDLSRPVMVGDSILAGFQNSSLMDSQQTNGIGALIARQARVDLHLPLIAAPGVPSVLVLADPGPPPIVVQASGTSTGRLDIMTQTLNLSVPGHRVIDALETRPDFPIDSLTDLILGLPGLLGGVSKSQVEWAEALHPTTIVVWIGNNDVLGAAIAGDASVATPVDQFENAYTNLMNRLAATGARLVIANIPDVTVLPFVVPVPEAAALFGVPAATLAGGLGIDVTDYITLDAVGDAVAILNGEAAAPLPPEDVLTANEVAILASLVNQYNTIIAAAAARHDAILVDTHAYLDQVNKRGVVVNGRRLTTAFLGGIFSLDGVHTSNTGAALTANVFIKTMNRQGKASIPPVNVLRASRTDPLLPPKKHGR